MRSHAQTGKLNVEVREVQIQKEEQKRETACLLDLLEHGHERVPIIAEQLAEAKRRFVIND